MSRKYNKRCYGRQDLLLLPSGLQNPKKTLDNQDTHMITSVMLARQITLPPLLLHSCSLLVFFLRPLSFVFNSLQPLFAKHPGWGYAPGSLDIHTFNPSHDPAPQLLSFLSHSCDYALFCATATQYLYCFQCLAHSFYRDGGGTPST